MFSQSKIKDEYTDMDTSTCIIPWKQQYFSCICPTECCGNIQQSVRRWGWINMDYNNMQIVSLWIGSIPSSALDWNEQWLLIQPIGFNSLISVSNVRNNRIISVWRFPNKFSMPLFPIYTKTTVVTEIKVWNGVWQFHK